MIDFENRGPSGGEPLAVRDVSAGSTETSTSASSHDVLMPTLVEEGDLLLVFIAIARGSNATPGASGWTVLFNTDQNSRRGTCLYKIADGTEGGASVTFTTPSSGERSAHISFSIAGWTDFDGTSSGYGASNPDCPTLTFGTSEETIWIVSVAAAEPEGDPTAPSGYSNTTHTRTSTSTSDDDHVRQSTARKTSTASSENPSTWTLTDTVSICGTVGIR